MSELIKELISEFGKLRTMRDIVDVMWKVYKERKATGEKTADSKQGEKARVKEVDNELRILRAMRIEKEQELMAQYKQDKKIIQNIRLKAENVRLKIDKLENEILPELEGRYGKIKLKTLESLRMIYCFCEEEGEVRKLSFDDRGGICEKCRTNKVRPLELKDLGVDLEWD